MRRSFDQSEYTQPGAEFDLPPEQSATLQGGRHFADRFGAPSRTLAEPGEAEEQILGALPEEGPGEAPKEEAPSPAEQDMKQTEERKTKRKRSLLLQFAAAASSVVLVTNSFGIDFLGMDGLFNDSVILGEVSTEHDPENEHHNSESKQIFGDLISFGGDRIIPRLSNEWTVTQYHMVDAHNRYIATAEFVEGSMGEQAMVEGFVWADRKDAQYFSGPIPMSFPSSVNYTNTPYIAYDEDSNTLTLNNYHGQGLVVNGMGQDFTIRLEGDNRLDHYLLVGGGSLTITGDGGIFINEDQEFDYGILLAGQWSEACLMIDEDVKFDISGRYSVFRVSATCSDKPMWHKSYSPWPKIYQGQMVDENTSPIRGDTNHYYSWLTCGEGHHTTIVNMNNGYRPGGEERPTNSAETQPVETQAPVTVSRMPVGGDSTFPMLPNPMPNSVGLDGAHHESSILVWEYCERDGRLHGEMSIFSYEQHHPTGRDDIFYDPSSNTLTLNNFSGARLDLRNMGSSFKIKLTGRNELSCGIQMLGDLTSGSITFTGDGYLALNTSGLSTYGLWLDAGSAPACVMIEDAVIMDLYGEQAITVWNTTADKAIYCLSGTVAGVYQESDYGEKSTSTGDTVYDWKSVDAQGNPVGHIHFGGEVPPETERHTKALPEGAIPIGPDQSYPDTSDYPFNGMTGTSMSLGKITGSNIFYIGDDLNYNNNDYDGIEIYNDGSYSEVLLNNTIPGLRFDPETCTLFLTDFRTDQYLGIGVNGTLTIHLEGENELEMITIRPGASYGYTSYCGLVFEGSGSLTLNKDRLVMHGIHMEAQFTPGFIGVGSDVTLTAYGGGSGSPIVILNTESEKAIYRISADEAVPGVVQAVVDAPSYYLRGYTEWHVFDTSDGYEARVIRFEPTDPAFLSR